MATTETTPCTCPKQLKGLNDLCSTCQQENSAHSDAEWLLWQQIFDEGDRLERYARSVSAALNASFPLAS